MPSIVSQLAASCNFTSRAFRPLIAVAQARRAGSALAVTLVLALITVWWGFATASLPSASPGARIPLYRFMAMGTAIVPVLALYSPLHDLEGPATDQYWRTERVYLALMAATSSVVYLALASITLPATTLVLVGRSIFGWIGLALVSGRVLGWRLAWVLPVATIFVLLYWGSVDHGYGYRWWEFSARPHDDIAALLVSVVLLAAGAAAMWATPWRLRARHRSR